MERQGEKQQKQRQCEREVVSEMSSGDRKLLKTKRWKREKRSRIQTTRRGGKNGPVFMSKLCLVCVCLFVSEWVHLHF